MSYRKLLLPFSGLFWIGVSLRNLAYNVGLLPSRKFKIPVIVIGNLSVGGTGKSPHTMMIADILKDGYSTAMLSRGYGRKTSGLKVANYDSKVYDIGDEPLQFFNRFKNKLVVVVSENRVSGIEFLIKRFNPKVVLMDDGYQHRQVKPGMSILLTDFNHPYTSDYLLPAGNLREPRRGARRADIIVITKCPDEFSVKSRDELLARIKPRPHQKVFFSKIVYSNTISGYRFTLDSYEWNQYDVLLITGIAKSEPLVEFVTGKFKKVTHKEYPDHHNFSIDDIIEIEREYENMESLNKIILTTEKDYMRLKDESSIIENLFYRPIEVELNDFDGFKQTLLNYVEKN